MSAGPYSIGSTVWPGLSKLIEEMGECQQVAGKLIATGGEPQHWDGTDLRERLTEEIADALAACRFVAEANGLDIQAIDARARKKVELFRKWHEEQATVPT